MCTDDTMEIITGATIKAMREERFRKALDMYFMQGRNSTARVLKIFQNIGVRPVDASREIAESAKEVCKDVKPL